MICRALGAGDGDGSLYDLDGDERASAGAEITVEKVKTDWLWLASTGSRADLTRDVDAYDDFLGIAPCEESNWSVTFKKIPSGVSLRGTDGAGGR